MAMTIKLSTEFINKLKLPNYIISGFRYRFSTDMVINGVRLPLDSDMSSITNVDDINNDMIRVISSPFRCSTILSDNKLSLSVTTKDDTNENYNWLLIYYYDMMINDFSSVSTKSVNNVESGLRLAAVADYKSLKRYEISGTRKGMDIPNIIELKGLDIKCSILTRYFNPDEITHIVRTDLTCSDYTDESMAVNKTLLRSKPTENYLHDNMISLDRSVDSFMIGSSGIINICNEGCIQ